MTGESARQANADRKAAGQVFDTACLYLREGRFSEGMSALENVLEADVEFPGAAAAVKCAAFWHDCQEKEEAAKEGFERGEQLLGQWRLFQAFAARLPETPERCLFAIKQFVFSAALVAYGAPTGSSLEGEEAAVEPAAEDPYLLLQMGRCYKGVGNYERAIECLERANRESRDDARVLAELADCYSLVNESRAAKIFFREAFFVDPQAVDLAGLESPLVHRLAARLRQRGLQEPLLNEWMPVYGAIWGVFNVKREMKPLEFGKLKQAIYQLEKERRQPGPGAERATPRLINRYFWLIDHYRSTGESRDKVEEVLQRLKETDPRVHADYTT